ncbi:MAG: hypothetical protein ACEY3L_08060 [Wolbachia sp.]
MLADEIPRMNRGMTVRSGMTITSSSRYLLAGSIRGGCKLKIRYKRNKREDNSTHYRNSGRVRPTRRWVSVQQSGCIRSAEWFKKR